MDRETLLETIKKRRQDGGREPAHIRARNARQRLLAAAAEVEYGPKVRRNVWPATAVALAAGLLAGYSPRTTRILLSGVAAMVQEWLKTSPKR